MSVFAQTRVEQLEKELKRSYAELDELQPLAVRYAHIVPLPVGFKWTAPADFESRKRRILDRIWEIDQEKCKLVGYPEVPCKADKPVSTSDRCGSVPCRM
jgi:hypothetical protein